MESGLKLDGPYWVGSRQAALRLRSCNKGALPTVSKGGGLPKTAETKEKAGRHKLRARRMVSALSADVVVKDEGGLGQLSFSMSDDPVR